MENYARAKLEVLLSKMGISAKSSSLLQAYATFKSMRDCTPDSLSQCYAEVCSQSPADSLIPERDISEANNAYQAYMEFRKFSFEEFLRFIVPDLITDISSFMRIFQEYFDSDICRITYRHFYNQLELSREQQFDVCKAFYILKRPVKGFESLEDYLCFPCGNKKEAVYLFFDTKMSTGRRITVKGQRYYQFCSYR